MPLFSFGYNFPHKHTFGKSLAKFSITPEFGQKVKQESSAEEFFIFKSENSFEVFAVSEQRDAFQSRFLKVLLSQSDFSLTELEKYRFDMGSADAVRHFYERFIGLEKPGVISQSEQAFRNSFLLARKMRLTGPRFNRLFQRGLWLAEKVRLELNLHKSAFTPETVVANLAQKIFGDLHDHSALIVGKSTHCESFVKTLFERNIGKLSFVDLGRGGFRNVSEKYQCKLVSADQLGLVLASVDLILLFNEGLIDLDQKEFSRIMNQRNNAPLLFATLFDHKNEYDFSNLYNIYYYSKEDLRTIVASNLKEHQKVATLVNRLIDGEVEDFISWMDSNDQYRFGNIIGKSEAMQNILELIARVAQTNTSVLIEGESGTGKELIAQAIHEHSARSRGAFVVVNCGAIPETLLESELFGYVRGAFTGADNNKKGLFEAANHSTIFLDEIGETSPATQVKLLRFLQSGEIKPLGSNQAFNLDVRVIAATNRNLEQMVKDGTFRQDLYYRLNVIQINAPPLRERPEDVPPLVEHFMKKYAQKINKTVYHFDEEALGKLTRYDWQGNVRELENAIERAVALSSGNVLTPLDLPPAIVYQQSSEKENHFDNLSLKDLEKRHIRATLEKQDWNYDLVTKILGIGRTTLWRKMKEYKISNVHNPNRTGGYQKKINSKRGAVEQR